MDRPVEAHTQLINSALYPGESLHRPHPPSQVQFANGYERICSEGVYAVAESLNPRLNCSARLLRSVVKVCDHMPLTEGRAQLMRNGGGGWQPQGLLLHEGMVG